MVGRQYRLLLFVSLTVGLTVAACRGAVIGSYYESKITSRGLIRSGSHAGVDFLDRYGAPVLAAADGQVINVGNSNDPKGCGLGVLLAHREFKRYTVYCHLSEIEVDFGQWVKRGDTIGFVGAPELAANDTSPQVHFELCTYPCTYGHRDGNLVGTEDPLVISTNCYDPRDHRKTYPTDRLVLTYPVKCVDRE